MTKRTIFMAALAGAITLLSFGCGGTNHLQSITLTASGSSGTFEVKGEGGTLQLKATGNISNGGTKDITGQVRYTVTAVGNALNPAGGTMPLAAPPQTLLTSTTGLATAVSPFVCTFTQVGTNTPPTYALVGSYQVVASMDGVASQPVFIAVASATGNGPGSACGP